jgi:hypothetical protein
MQKADRTGIQVAGKGRNPTNRQPFDYKLSVAVSPVNKRAWNARLFAPSIQLTSERFLGCIIFETWACAGRAEVLIKEVAL